MRKKSLTVEELKLLLLARFNIEQSKQAKLQERLQQALGGEVQEKKPEAIAIEKKFADWISDILARRLKRNRRASPFLSARDFVKFVPTILDIIEQAEGEKLDAEERKMFEKFMKAIFENIFEIVRSMVPEGKNPYEEFWRWTQTVLDLAAERGVLPTELFALEGMTDEITRRMFSKKEFVTLYKKAVNKFIDADTLKKILIQPLLDTITEDDEEERREMEKEIETEIMPQLREIVEKSKVVISNFLTDEVARIYAVA